MTARAALVAMILLTGGCQSTSDSWSRPVRFAAFAAPRVGSDPAPLASVVALIRGEGKRLAFVVVMGPFVEPGEGAQAVRLLRTALEAFEVPTYLVLTADDDAEALSTLHGGNVFVASGPYNAVPPSAPGVLLNVLSPGGEGRVGSLGSDVHRLIEVQPMDIKVQPMEIYHPYEHRKPEWLTPDLVIRKSQFEGGGSNSSFLWGPYYRPRQTELSGGADLELLSLSHERPIAVVTLWTEHAMLEAMTLSGDREVVYGEGVPLPRPR